MKVKLFAFARFFVVVLVAAVSQSAFSNHYLAATITYTQVAPGSYNVKLQLVQDCNSGGTVTPHTIDIKIASPACSGFRFAPITRQIGSPVINQQCTQFGIPACPPSLINYSGIITLTAAELSCQNIVFSWTDCCMPVLANLQNSPLRNFYTEATVRTMQNLPNSSPDISSLEHPLPTVRLNSEMVYALGGTDPDCDSLSYELVAPLIAANTVTPYGPTPPNYSPNFLVANQCPKTPYGNNSTNSQYAELTGPGPANFSPTYPIPSVHVNWDGPATIPMVGAPFTGLIWAATNRFRLDPASGMLSFHPTHYVYNGGPGAERYIVEVLISEWRKINGVITRMGTTRRSILFSVFDDGKINPRLHNFIANGQAVSSGQVITLPPGTPLNLQFSNGSLDCGSSFPVTISSNAATVLPGAVFSATSGLNAAGTITWNGSLHCNVVKYIQLKVEDDACPVRGFQLQTIGVRISNTNVTGVQEPVTASLNFSAFPNPFTRQIQFRFTAVNLGKQELWIYNSLGQLVDQLEIKGAGEQEVVWERAANQRNGLYIARLVQPGQPLQTIRFTKAE